MPLSRRDLLFAAPLLGALVTRPAAADVAGFPRMRRPRPRQPQLVFQGAHVSRRAAPDVDVELVHQQTTLAISRQRPRMARCIRQSDLRRDPNHRGARELTVTLTFNRSSRPQVRMGRGHRFSSPARACVREALRGINIRAVPQGSVTIEARFALV